MVANFVSVISFGLIKETHFLERGKYRKQLLNLLNLECNLDIYAVKLNLKLQLLQQILQFGSQQIKFQRY
jgi:hypothetical protein